MLYDELILEHFLLLQIFPPVAKKLLSQYNSTCRSKSCYDEERKYNYSF